MKNLKVLYLTYCRNLERTPYFSTDSNLERLILSDCLRLIEIDRSIYQLKRLVFLDVSNCRQLQRLPETIGNLESLTKLDISSTKIEVLPNSIVKLKNLKVLKMQAGEISKLPDSFWAMEKLEEIEIVGKRYPGEHFNMEIGDCIYGNKSLRILRLIGWKIHALPMLCESLIILELQDLHMDTFPDVSNLTKLKLLHLEFGPPNSDGNSDGLLEEPIPQWIGNFSQLECLQLRFFGVTASSTDLSLPPHPRRLPRLPSSLSSLLVQGWEQLCLMDLSNLRKLSSLSILGSAVTEIQGLGCLENLRDLDLDGLGLLAMLPDLRKLNKLRIIRVIDCGYLVEIQGELPRFLDELNIDSCPSLLELPDLFSLMGKTVVRIHECGQALSHAFMDRHQLLLLGFKQLQILPDLSNLNELTFLQVENCGNLVMIQGELPQSLEELHIVSCGSLQKLPDLSTLKGLRKVIIKRCGKLDVEEISWLCSEKSVEFVGEDDDSMFDWVSF
ncbi:disease resistance protein RPV1-like [Eucalyptus grandis]|uniref:disease resistance protein RPV1-like n=1 Tax=Eucalyptus grandis TaxID=71139 RepID=UPI00192ED55B|nr:disease resistance protein RPV1-like [Eucalyptus grandis]